MLSKTKAIILHTIKYSETSVIAYCYSENFGRISLLIQGVRKKNAKIKLNLLQPLQINEIDFYYKEKPGLLRLKELRSLHSSNNLLTDTKKSATALFLAEILYKTLKEEIKNTEQYRFIETNIERLNNLEKGFVTFYLKFLIDYTLYLGFYPNTSFHKNAKYFDLKNGVFTTSKPPHEFILHNEPLIIFKHLLFSEENEVQNYILSHNQRDLMLNYILDFYLLHVDGINNIKSLIVLRELFHD